MVVDMGNYDIVLRLDFLIKIGVVIDVEKCTIQVKHHPSSRSSNTPFY
jgi:hypothetical protein